MPPQSNIYRRVYDAIVVGLGPAGVAAFTSLHKNGIDVLALEAGNRVGGRIHSVNFGDAIIDLGAEWCHGKSENVVYEMLKDSGLPISSDNPGITLVTFFDSDGTRLSKDLSEKMSNLCCDITDMGREELAYNNDSLGENFVKIYEKLVNSNVYSNIPRKITDQTLEWFHKFENSLEASDSWYDTAGSTYSEYWECEGDHLLHWNGKGYKTVINHMLKSLPESQMLLINEHLNKEVININYEDSENNETIVKVKCQDNNVYHAKHVIVTVSLGVLQEKYKTLFTPSLPAQKINSIKHLTLGTVNKMFLYFKKRWWTDDMIWVGFLWQDEHKNLLQKEDKWLLDILGFNSNDGQPNVLCFWITGPNSRYMETLPVEQVQKGINFLIKMFLGKNFEIPAPCDFLRSTWYTDPLFRGSYTFRSVDTEKFGASSLELSLPIVSHNKNPVICFAGEATSSHYYSTVHGAVESGYRESQRIINFIKSKNKIPENFDAGVIRKKIVIIGGGTAGLAAARTFVQNGILDILLVESSNRLGGRICSVKVDGKFLELGAQWIHGETNKFTQYVRKQNLITNIDSYEGEGKFLRNDGFEYPFELVKNVHKVVSDILEKSEAFYEDETDHNFSLGEYLKTEFEKYVQKKVNHDEIELWNEIFNWHIRFQCIDNACISVDCLSAKQWGAYDFDGGNSQSHISFKNGFASFIDKISSEIPDNIIQLSTKVNKVVWYCGDKVNIYCSDNNVYEVDHVIITVPLGVLKYDHGDMFEPRLPSMHVSAIESIGFGPIGKIFLRFKENWWGENKGFQMTWKKEEMEKLKLKKVEDWVKYISGFDVLTVGPPNTLIGWISSEGNKLIQDIPDDQVIQQCYELLMKFTGLKDILKPTSVYRSKWDNDSNVRGGFCHITRECDKTKLGPKNLSEPIYNRAGKLQLLFAGEACHPNFFSTVHGAFESGIQQAETLCELNESLCRSLSKL